MAWTEADDELLKKLINDGATRESIGFTMHKSPKSINNRIRQLLLKSNNRGGKPCREWTAMDDKKLVAMIRQRTPYKDIRRELKRSERDVKRRVRALGIERPRSTMVKIRNAGGYDNHPWRTYPKQN